MDAMREELARAGVLNFNGAEKSAVTESKIVAPNNGIGYVANWKWVPLKPTNSMLSAASGCRKLIFLDGILQDAQNKAGRPFMELEEGGTTAVQDLYAAMIAAAPEMK